MSIEPVTANAGWGVLHLFFHLRRDVVGDPHFDSNIAARAFTGMIETFSTPANRQAITFSVLGQKADLGIMLVAPDLVELDRFAVELAGSPLGQALVPGASYVSLTELSEYTATDDEESARLVEEEGLAEGSTEHSEALTAFSERMASYRDNKLHPRLPHKRVIGFYPMSKRRGEHENWFTLDFAERKRLMAGHAAVGRSYRGRVLQLITGSAGLDDWEWGVTLLADDPDALKEIVYEMRFDEVSAKYGEFGPFVTGLIAEPDDLMRHLSILDG